MDYKKIIKSRKVRFAILNFLSFVPDELMVKIQYRIKTGRKLDLKNPKRFSEKIQKYKLNYRNDIMKKCVDKYEVRTYVKNKGLENILNEVYGIYDNAKDINFDMLPPKFVIKLTTGGGGLNVIICNDKKNFDREAAIIQVNEWMNLKQKKTFGREWAYSNLNNRIIVEKLIETNENNGLIDYKFFCFNGEVSYLYVITDRKFAESAKLGIYDKNFNKIDAYRNDELRQEKIISKPTNYDKMIEYAEILSKDFPHARIDLYNNNGDIIFGEITFYDGSGYMTYSPDDFDYKLGEKFII